MPAHIKAALLPVQLSVPVAAGQMRLGTWQGIYLVEHRLRPDQRIIAPINRVRALYIAVRNAPYPIPRG